MSVKEDLEKQLEEIEKQLIPYYELVKKRDELQKILNLLKEYYHRNNQRTDW